MSTIINIHQHFARYFKDKNIEPYLYELSRLLGEGHICIDPLDLDIASLKEAGYVEQPSIDHLNNTELVSSGDRKTPFVYASERLYMQRYYYYESLILNKIKRITTLERDSLPERLRKLKELIEEIRQLFAGSDKNTGVTDWQWLAAISTVLHDFSIITGGPGTGKTTTVAKVLSLLLHINKDIKIALCAPTGKAAARMAESLRKAAYGSSSFIRDRFEQLVPATIHRLLGPIAGHPDFKHNSTHPLEADVIIVDEASMIDVALMAKLLDAVPDGCKLILLGDKDQLASVEAGSLFGDLCNALPSINDFSDTFLNDIKPLLPRGAILPSPYKGENENHLLFEHIVALKQSHRFSDDAGIGRFSKAILNNDANEIKAFWGNQDKQLQIEENYNDQLIENFVLGYKAFIEEPDIQKALFKLNRIRVLCAVRETTYGVEAINKRIEKILRQEAGLQPFQPYYEHRPIMVTSNNQQLNLFNGDIGILRKDESGVMKAWFETADGSLRSVLPGFIGSLETAFAMTIHKSQGSEFNEVLVILPESEQAGKILTRELLYTAVTRAREKVLILGERQTLLNAASVGIHRGSGVKRRLQQNLF